MIQSKRNLGDCRFYEKRFPEPEESVMVKVERIESMGAYVSLPEYNDMEGMILMTELSKVRFRSVNKLIRVGRHEVVIVLRVDPKKGYIDLSKRRVSPEDIIKCEERFSRAKKINQTIRHVAKIHDMRVDELNSKVTWPLEKAHGDAYEALKKATRNPSQIFKDIDIADDIKESILHDIQIRFAAQALKLRTKIDLWCFGHDGIDAVKSSLAKVKDFETPDVKLSVKLIAPPGYVVVSTCYNKQIGMEIMKDTLEIIRDTILSYKGGGFKQQEEIVVMGGEEEKRLEQLLNAVEDDYDDDDDDDPNDDNKEDDDDDDDEEEDEGMGKVDEDDESIKNATKSNHKREDNFE